MSNSESRGTGLAVVRAEFTVTNPELLLFLQLPGFQTRFYGFRENDSEWASHPLFTSMQLFKQIPDRFASLLTRRPYSPTSPVTLASVSALEDAEVIETAEAYSSISLQCAKLADRWKKKIVISVWETLTGPSFWQLPPYIFNIYRVKKRGPLFLAHSKRAISHLRSIGVPRDSIALVYPGVDIEAFSPARYRNHHNFRILFVGRFDSEKGLTTLLQAFSELHREGKDVELWIRAKEQQGRLRHIAYEYARRLPIRLIGTMDYKCLPQLYRDCDVLCLPSVDRAILGLRIWEEQFGFVLVEAMACGLPVIGARCGAIPEVIGPGNPIVEQSSPKGLMRELKRLYVDERLRENLSRQNRERAANLFNLDKQRSRVAQVLQELSQHPCSN